MPKRDCTKTIDYLKTRAEMTQLDENGFCRIHCDDCALANQIFTKRCEVLEYLYPHEAIKIIQRYADIQLVEELIEQVAPVDRISGQ